MAKLKPPKTETAKPGVWFPIGSKWHRDICCDCGLVHKNEYRIVRVLNKNGTVSKTRLGIQQRAYRDNRMTARLRKTRKWDRK